MTPSDLQPPTLPGPPDGRGEAPRHSAPPGPAVAKQRPLPPARRLLVVDLSNVVMGCSSHGSVPPAVAVHRATALMQDILRYVNPSHLVIAADARGATLRKQQDPTYKGSRVGGRTTPYAVAAEKAWRALGWPCISGEGYEADDYMAILATEAEVDEVFLLTNDSDARALVADATPYGPPIRRADGTTHQRTRRVEVLRPNGRHRPLTRINAEAVRALYQLTEPAQLVDLKALAGDRGDEVHGVPGLTQRDAAALLRAHGSVEGIIAAGRVDGARGHARHVAQHADQVRHALALVQPMLQAPLPETVRRCTAVVEYRRAYHRTMSRPQRRHDQFPGAAPADAPDLAPDHAPQAAPAATPGRRVVGSAPAPNVWAPLDHSPDAPEPVASPPRVAAAAPEGEASRATPTVLTPVRAFRRQVATFFSSLFG